MHRIDRRTKDLRHQPSWKFMYEDKVHYLPLATGQAGDRLQRSLRKLGHFSGLLGVNWMRAKFSGVLKLGRESEVSGPTPNQSPRRVLSNANSVRHWSAFHGRSKTNEVLQ